MLEFITEMVGWTFDIRDDAVVITKEGGSFKGPALETEFIPVDPGVIKRITGESIGGGDVDPFAVDDNDMGGGDEGKQIHFLENAGVKF